MEKPPRSCDCQVFVSHPGKMASTFENRYACLVSEQWLLSDASQKLLAGGKVAPFLHYPFCVLLASKWRETVSPDFSRRGQRVLKSKEGVSTNPPTLKLAGELRVEQTFNRNSSVMLSRTRNRLTEVLCKTLESNPVRQRIP